MRAVRLQDLTRVGLWIALYVLLALYPLLWLAAVPAPGGGGDLRQELAAALGFLGLSIMAMQFLLTARFQWLAPPFGTDVVYAFHRHVTAVALAFLLLHPLVLLGPGLGGLAEWLLPWRAPGPVGAGVWSLYALLVLAVTSYGRRRLRLPYEAWRVLHGAAATAAVLLGLWHAAAARRLLAGPVTRVMWIAWTLAWVALLLRVRVAKPLALRARPYRVSEVRPERGDAVTLVLDPDGHEGFRFRAGQFAWLTLGASPFAAREHPFSISGSSQRAPRVELTVKALGDFTQRVQATRPGARAWVDGPYGTMSVDAFPDADGYLFVAGGIGVAPCLSMLRTLADRGDRRPHQLVFGTGRWERTPFREALAELATRLDLTVVHVLEHPPDGWTGEVGVVGEDVLRRHLPRGHRGCFVCGPPAMMDAVETALVRLGVPLRDIHSERFDLV
ncbi:oxidoreductase FAD/NAD(P)-binding domain protein [Anaeromyxobacter sp. K]|uniref:ferredoxin reductase family protein n=1 Tax=Anaeromyxobacter sp. (strain K) TaxID=447217 RepID=UPI00015F9B83|nr:ferredoxin reductase family protein [Anaeromyxobacter sp. K]ACG71552.1 oxidoreductase FAD/NAD(P)-binding domain protein [Anaeromyxobacter sp. K]